MYRATAGASHPSTVMRTSVEQLVAAAAERLVMSAGIP